MVPAIIPAGRIACRLERSKPTTGYGYGARVIELGLLIALMVGAAFGLSERRRRRAIRVEPAEAAQLLQPELWAAADQARPLAATPARAGETAILLNLVSLRLRPQAAAVALAAGLCLSWLGQQLLSRGELSPSAVGFYMAGLLLIAGLDWKARQHESPTAQPNALPARAREAQETPRVTLATRLLLAFSVVGGLLVWGGMLGRQPTDSYSDIVWLWVLTMGSALAAAAPPRWFSRATFMTAARSLRSFRSWIVPLALVAAALSLRIVAIDRVPYAFGGDEGSQALSARAALDGQVRNPFGTGWYSVSTLFFFVQAGSLAVFGDSVFGARMLSAIVGTMSVLVTYLFVRRLFGTNTAIIAASILAVFHFHIHFSRLASIQIMDPLLILLILYLLDRGLVEPRPLECLMGGLTVGLSQYFSFAGRAFPFIAAAYVAFHFIRSKIARGGGDSATRPEGQTPPRSRLVGWILLGALLAYLPLMAYYQDHPAEFNTRINQVSMFSSGWLEREQQLTGRSAPDLVLNQIQRAALLPFHTPPGGWYVGDRPYLGVAMALPIAIGLAVVTLGVWRREYVGVGLAYWAFVLGLGLTEDPTQTQRFVVATSLMAILAAVGITRVARVARDLARLPRVAVNLAVAVAVAGLLGWNVIFYFGPNPTWRYGDANTLVAMELAYRMRDLGPGYSLYFLGAPRLSWRGFSSAEFIAPHTRAVDVDQVWNPSSSPPPVSGPTVFAAVPERAAELSIVASWFPGGRPAEYRQPGGQLLFLTYEVARQ